MKKYQNMNLDYGSFSWDTPTQRSLAVSFPQSKKKTKQIEFTKEISRVVETTAQLLGLDHEDVFDMLELKREKWNRLRYYSNPATGSIRDLYNSEQSFSLLLDLPVEIFFTQLVHYLSIEELISLAKTSPQLYGEFIRHRKYIFHTMDKKNYIYRKIMDCINDGDLNTPFYTSLYGDTGMLVWDILNKKKSMDIMSRHTAEDRLMHIINDPCYKTHIIHHLTDERFEMVEQKFKRIYKIILKWMD